MIIVQVRWYFFYKNRLKTYENSFIVGQFGTSTQNTCFLSWNQYKVVFYQMKNLSLFVLIFVGVASLDFPLFNQCDSKWANERVGLSTYTICKAGDVITSVAMAMTALGKNQNPSTLNNWLKANKGYDKNSNLVWNSITSFGMTYEGMIPNSLIKLNLDVGYILIIEVSKGPHYVLATGYSGNTIHVNDPLYTTTQAYDISTVVSGKTAVYKIPVTSSPYKLSFFTSLLNKIASKTQTNSLLQE